MAETAIMAAFGAAFVAMAGAIFGALLARMLWAEDLKHAQQIDEIRSKTEVHLRDSIMSLKRQIDLLKRSR